MSEYEEKANVFEIVNAFFKNADKTRLWMNTKNPLLGDESPINMIHMGRTKKLLSFIETQLTENKIDLEYKKYV